MLLHMVDEASRFHACVVLKQGFFDSDQAMGNVDAALLVSTLKETWLRYFLTPKRIHCDSESVFRSNLFLDFCGERNIRVVQCAGEAHWQLGLVERHIKTLNDMVQRMFLEVEGNIAYDDAQDVVDKACEAKNFQGRYGGFSPSQWLQPRLHPLLQAEAVPPNLTEESPFFVHVRRRSEAAAAFHYAEARSLLRLALHARSRRLSEVKPGDIVYYYRRGKAAGARQRGSYKGPARVLAVEPPESDAAVAPGVVWLSHAGVLVRAAPEHLRMATPLEVTIEQAIRGPAAAGPGAIAAALRREGRRPPQYLDLGSPPSLGESQEADAPDMDVDVGGGLGPFHPDLGGPLAADHGPPSIIPALPQQPMADGVGHENPDEHMPEAVRADSPSSSSDHTDSSSSRQEPEAETGASSRQGSAVVHPGQAESPDPLVEGDPQPEGQPDAEGDIQLGDPQPPPPHARMLAGPLPSTPPEQLAPSYGSAIWSSCCR
jgi:hypothetical protein